VGSVVSIFKFTVGAFMSKLQITTSGNHEQKCAQGNTPEEAGFFICHLNNLKGFIKKASLLFFAIGKREAVWSVLKKSKCLRNISITEGIDFD